MPKHIKKKKKEIEIEKKNGVRARGVTLTSEKWENWSVFFIYEAILANDIAKCSSRWVLPYY